MIKNFLLIIGAMKCGTTSLFYYLSEHPSICPCRQKEPNFFASDQNWSKGFKWYQSLWDFEPNKHLIAMESSTHYTKIPNFPNASERILKVGEDVKFKFIYIMRNPIERIESHYTHGLQENWPWARKSIEQGIEGYTLELSKYAKQIDEYHKRFPQKDILLLNFEDLKLNPLRVLRKICSFLNIDDSFEFSRTNNILNTSTEKRIDSPAWTVIEPITRYWPQRLRNSVRSSLGKKVEKKVKLSDRQKDFVLNELYDDLHKLKFVYGVDISCWGIEI